MAYLELSEGAREAKIVPLGEETSIGRGPANSLQLSDNMVSRHHALFKRVESYYSLTDLGSANGTFVNKVRLRPFVPVLLHDRDRVVVCSARMVFRATSDIPASAEALSDDTAEGGEPSEVVTKTQITPVVPLVRHETKSDTKVNATLDAAAAVSSMGSAAGGDDSALLKRLRAMVRVSTSLSTVTRIPELLNRIMSDIFDAFPHADRAFIMRMDRATGQMAPAAGRRRQGGNPEKSEEFAISSTVIQSVVDKKQSVLCRDALDDERFRKKESVVNLHIRSLMCVPFLCKGELLGLICVDTLSPLHPFCGDDLAMLTAIAAQAAVAIKNAELYETLEHEVSIRTQLCRYLSPTVVEGVLEGLIPLELGGELRRGTFMFCDIVGFSRMAENVSALDVIEHLNRAFRVITRIIAGNKGVLHKFGGDMAMAFWNVMFPDTNAERNAIRTSLEIQVDLWLFNLRLEAEGHRPISVGAGCNTGECAGGNLGGAEHMEYTVVGDSVNLSKRIESLAGRQQVFVSHDTYRPAQDVCTAVGLRPVTVKGRTAPIKVYSIRGMGNGYGSMLLNIPVFILTPDGRTAASGLVTGCEGADSVAPILHLVTGAELGSWGTLMVQFDLPELTHVMRLNAKIADVKRMKHASASRAEYSKIALSDLECSPEILSFLKPGALLESNKNWELMKRQ